MTSMWGQSFKQYLRTEDDMNDREDQSTWRETCLLGALLITTDSWSAVGLSPILQRGNVLYNSLSYGMI